MVKIFGQNMREVPASEAKAQLSALLDAVEQGETVAIKRHGRRVARLVPEEAVRRRNVRRALAVLDAIRKRSKPVTPDEVREWINEGRE